MRGPIRSQDGPRAPWGHGADRRRILATLSDEELFHWRGLFGDWPQLPRRRVEQLEAAWWRRLNARMEWAAEALHHAVANDQQARIDMLVASLGMMRVATSAAGKTWAYAPAVSSAPAASTPAMSKNKRAPAADLRPSKNRKYRFLDYPGRVRRRVSKRADCVTV